MGEGILVENTLIDNKGHNVVSLKKFWHPVFLAILQNIYNILSYTY